MDCKLIFFFYFYVIQNLINPLGKLNVLATLTKKFKNEMYALTFV